MDTDLDSLLTVVFCTADDLLPTPAGNARRIVTDAEVVTLALAQVLLGYHDSDRRFVTAARRRLSFSATRHVTPRPLVLAGSSHRRPDGAIALTSGGRAERAIAMATRRLPGSSGVTMAAGDRVRPGARAGRQSGRSPCHGSERQRQRG